MPFTDVDDFAAAIEWLYTAGITGGCAPTLFCPNAQVTRAQMAMFLDRALDLPAATTDYFDDDDGKTGEASINALAKAKITGGCAPRRYCPSAYVTRAQMAMFLDRAPGPAQRHDRLLRRRRRADRRGQHQRPGQGRHHRWLRHRAATARAGPSRASRWPPSCTAPTCRAASTEQRGARRTPRRPFEAPVTLADRLGACPSALS